MFEGYTDEVGLAICKQDFSLRWVFDGFSVLVQTCGPLNIILVHFPLVLLERMGRTANPFSGKVGETVISHHAGENTDMTVGCHERRGLHTKPRQYGGYFADDTFKRIFLNENVRILLEISLRYVPEGPINNISVLVQIMAWRLPGDKPLSEPMMVRLPIHICVTWPQWVKGLVSIKKFFQV